MLALFEMLTAAPASAEPEPAHSFDNQTGEEAPSTEDSLGDTDHIPNAADFDLAALSRPAAGVYRGPERTTALGTTGNDRITVSESWGGPGREYLETIVTINDQEYQLTEADLNGFVIAGNGGNDKIVGSNHNDTIITGDGDDEVDGAGGDDTIFANGGNDRVWGGDGDDILWAGSGHDDIWGGFGNDQIWAGNGRDHVWAGDGDDIVKGGRGKDRLWGENGNDDLHGGAKRDKLIGGPGDDTLEGGWGWDHLVGGPGRDVLVIGFTDFHSGGEGRDDIDWPIFPGNAVPW